MYGGLFGDLPATKEEAEKEKNEGASTPAPSAAPSSSSAAQQQKKAKRGVGMAFVPAQAARIRPPQQPARSKKRPVPPPPSSQTPIITAATTSSTHPVLSSLATEYTTAVQSNERAAAELSSQENSIHAPDGSAARRADRPDDAPYYEIHPTIHPRQLPGNTNDEGTNPALLRGDFFVSAEEEEDPYDPVVPNDLLLYWEHKSLAAERERLQRERSETLAEQERLRWQLQRERRELAQAGDVGRLVAGMGRGRGRGVSNVPAWMVEKQRKQQQEGGVGPPPL